MATAVDKMVSGLEDFRHNMTAKDGLTAAIDLCDKLGGHVENNKEPEFEGIILRIGGESILVWQVYPDIDKIYYEY